MNGEPDILTISDVAEMLRCSKAHVCKIINGQVRGTVPIPVISLGRRKLIRRVSLLRWMSERERGATVESSLNLLSADAHKRRSLECADVGIRKVV